MPTDVTIKCSLCDSTFPTTEERDHHYEWCLRVEWPVHQPAAPDAPIPGRHWYSGCDPDRPRVDPATGICEGCGRYACPECGREGCDEHAQVDPLAPVSEYGSNLPWATPDARDEARRYAEAGLWLPVWEVLSTEADINAACGNQRKADLLGAASERAFALHQKPQS